MKFTMTPAACAAAFDSRDTEEKSLRISIQGGGCSGYQYALQWVMGPPAAGDKKFQFGDERKLTVYIDPISAMYLDGTEVDYVSTLITKGFVFNNPNAKTKCGCGKSFGA